MLFGCRGFRRYPLGLQLITLRLHLLQRALQAIAGGGEARQFGAQAVTFATQQCQMPCRGMVAGLRFNQLPFAFAKLRLRRREFTRGRSQIIKQPRPLRSGFFSAVGQRCLQRGVPCLGLRQHLPQNRDLVPQRQHLGFGFRLAHLQLLSILGEALQVLFQRAQVAGFRCEGLHRRQNGLQRHRCAFVKCHIGPAAQGQDGSVDIVGKRQARSQFALGHPVMALFGIDQFGQCRLEFMVGAAPLHIEFVAKFLGQSGRVLKPRFIRHDDRPVPPGMAQDVIIIGEPHDFRLRHRHGPRLRIFQTHGDRGFSRMPHCPDKARADVKLLENLAPQRQQAAGARILEAPGPAHVAQMLGHQVMQALLEVPDLRVAPPAGLQRHGMHRRADGRSQRIKDVILQRHDVGPLPEAGLVTLARMRRLVDHIDAEQVQDVGQQRCAGTVHAEHDDNFAALRAAPEIAPELHAAGAAGRGNHRRVFAIAHVRPHSRSDGR